MHFENIVGKGEMQETIIFLLFQQCFSTLSETNFNCSVLFNYKCCPIYLELDQSKICPLVNSE